MKEIQLKSVNDKIEGFPYQLTEWVEYDFELAPHIEQFKKYKQMHKMVLAKSPEGYAIFTTGEKIIVKQSTARSDLKGGRYDHT